MPEWVIQRTAVYVRRAGNWALNIFLVILGILMLAPFYWVFVTSLLTTKDAFQLPPVWFPSEVTLVNYRRVFELGPDVDTSRISAEMHQGVLKLHLPKSEKAKPKRIEVKLA